MKLDLMMVDYGYQGFQRYAIPIAREIKKRMPQAKIGAFYMDDYPVAPIDQFDVVQRLIEDNWHAKTVVDRYEPNAVLVFGHRVFDYMFTIEAHHRGISVFNFQHGLYMNSNDISELSVVSLTQVLKIKRDKFRQYVKCLCYICGGNPLQILKLASAFFRLRSLYKVINAEYGSLCHADYSFVYGVYWKDYYAKQYLERDTKYVVVGYPEMEQPTVSALPNNFAIPAKPMLCYLAQTSVEDGILSRQVMMCFLNNLAALTDEYNIIIKYHPRSNRSMYHEAFRNVRKGSTLEWKQEAFPIVDVYIGHESTVVARAINITERTVVCRLTENRASIFEDYTAYTVVDSNYLAETIAAALSNRPLKEKKPLSEYALENSDKGAIVKTVDVICRVIKKEC